MQSHIWVNSKHSHHTRLCIRSFPNFLKYEENFTQFFISVQYLMGGIKISDKARKYVTQGILFWYSIDTPCAAIEKTCIWTKVKIKIIICYSILYMSMAKWMEWMEVYVPVNTRAQVSASHVDTVPREHAHSLLLLIFAKNNMRDQEVVT